MLWSIFFRTNPSSSCLIDHFHLDYFWRKGKHQAWMRTHEEEMHECRRRQEWKMRTNRAINFTKLIYNLKKKTKEVHSLKKKGIKTISPLQWRLHEASRDQACSLTRNAQSKQIVEVMNERKSQHAKKKNMNSGKW